MERFLKAQAYTYSTAYQEIVNGFKDSHWMWFIFPQIYGLGFSPMSQKYELKSFDEAREYFNHEILGKRLLEITQAVYDLNAEDISYVMGYPDDLKLQSCMTLFALIVPENDIFKKVIDRYYKGEMCEYTVELFNKQEVFKLNTGYVIYASYGEYDDYNEIPMFFCAMDVEAHLFIEALENKEQPYWQKVVDFFRKRAGCEGNTAISDEEIEKYRMPSDLGFGLNKVEILSLMDKHPAT